jgi:hypothetical protein
MQIDLHKEPGLDELMKQDFHRNMMSLPRDALRARLLKTSPDLNEASLEKLLRGIQRLRERDPLADLQEGSLGGGKDGGQLNLMKLAPNFEIAMYLAQATGACIVTDSLFRWTEVSKAILQRPEKTHYGLAVLQHHMEHSEFAFPHTVEEILTHAHRKTFSEYPALMRDVFKYLLSLGDRGPKPNREAHLAARFAKAHVPAQAVIKKARIAPNYGRISCAFPRGGIEDNTVNRLLLMSSSERHLPSVPMAFLIESNRAAEGPDNLGTEPPSA